MEDGHHGMKVELLKKNQGLIQTISQIKSGHIGQTMAEKLKKQPIQMGLKTGHIYPGTVIITRLQRESTLRMKKMEPGPSGMTMEL